VERAKGGREVGGAEGRDGGSNSRSFYLLWSYIHLYSLFWSLGSLLFYDL